MYEAGWCIKLGQEAVSGGLDKLGQGIGALKRGAGTPIRTMSMLPVLHFIQSFLLQMFAWWYQQHHTDFDYLYMLWHFFKLGFTPYKVEHPLQGEKD